MQEYAIEIKRTLLHILLWGVMICGLAYLGDQAWRIPGFIMGILTSMIYFLLMCYRINKSATMSVGKAISYMRIGWFMRLAFIVLMLFLSIKIPALDFLAAVIGLFSLQAVVVINGTLLIVKSFLNSSR